ncbi:MAG: aldolase [Propionibacterium sp.]|nr:aldolase [Propionibacterium sp.]
MANEGSSLTTLKRPSGGFAMLAVDQREALRAMMSEAAGGASISDAQVVDFKLTAAKALTPHASAVLIDQQFALEAAVEQGVVDDSCALIASGDLFIPEHGELVGEVEIDPDIPPAKAKELGAVAQKLLVIWRADQPAEGRIDLVERFVAGCKEAGIVAIIEPVCKKPVDPATQWDHDESIVEAARELGSLGADLYKGEVPTQGKGTDDEMRAYYRRINDAVASEWVVLSSGVPEDKFAHAVELAIEEGGSGFLAGRAVWASCLTAADVDHCLQTAAVDRLTHLGEVVDAAMARRQP